MNDLYSRISALCERRGVTITEMCRGAGVSRSSLTELKMERISGLSLDAVAKIAAYFGKSVEYIRSGADNVGDALPSVSLTAEEEELVQAYRAAPQDTRMIVRLALKPYIQEGESEGTLYA